MFTHVMVGSDDLPGSTRFHDATSRPLGVAPAFATDRRAFRQLQG